MNLKVMLRDHLERPVAGYLGGHAATRVTQSGFQTPVEWKGGAGARIIWTLTTPLARIRRVREWEESSYSWNGRAVLDRCAPEFT